MVKTRGFGVERQGETNVRWLNFSREEPKDTELLVEILYCGLCHSDVEILANNWGITKYPCVPGHEAVGRVVATGAKVLRYQVGAIIGVGCIIDSCMACPACTEGWENHCEGPNGPTMTNGGYLTPGSEDGKAFNTLGAWADNVVVREDFAIRIPKDVDLAQIAPLMCAGTDIFGPLRRFGISPEKRIGVVGLGGPGECALFYSQSVESSSWVGHLAVQIAKAMGAGHVTVFTTHPDKRDAALRLGADEVTVSTDIAAMRKLSRSFHHILSTIPVPFEAAPYLALLRRRGSMTVMGLLGPYATRLNNFDLAAAGLSLTGSMIGSVAETQESVDFCVKNKILPEIELVEATPEKINQAIGRLKMADVRFRFVIKVK